MCVHGRVDGRGGWFSLPVNDSEVDDVDSEKTVKRRKRHMKQKELDRGIRINTYRPTNPWW